MNLTLHMSVNEMFYSHIIPDKIEKKDKLKRSFDLFLPAPNCSKALAAEIIYLFTTTSEAESISRESFPKVVGTVDEHKIPQRV